MLEEARSYFFIITTGSLPGKAGEDPKRSGFFRAGAGRLPVIMIKKYLRILAYVKPYWVSALLNIVFNLLVIVFSLVSFVMLVPFLNLLFGIEKLVDEVIRYA